MQTPAPTGTPDAAPSTPPTAAQPDTESMQGACRLSDWGVIRATGDEARKFLHGQLTQDVEHLGAQDARLAGYCSAKGRLLATLVVWQRAPDQVYLALSADLLATTLKRLSMFVLRAKCKLADASAELPLWGLAGDAATQAFDIAGSLPVWGKAAVAGGELLRLPDAVTSQQRVPRFLYAGVDTPAAPSLSADGWQWLEVHSGVARVVAATTEQFVPQMVNLELVGGVNFQKGCYPGQEVVARSQYRGTLKRRAYVVHSQAAMRPGQEVFHSADPGQPAGMVVLAASMSTEAHAALVELKIAALETGSLRAAAPQVPAQPDAAAAGTEAPLGTPVVPFGLPYALPQAEPA
jgi:folate-binding protein YgfZ